MLVVGHSEGALLGLLAARQAPIDGYVSLAGAGRAVGVVLREQLRRQLDDASFAQADQVITQLEAGRIVTDLPDLPELAALFRPSVQPYLISWMSHEPTGELQQLEAPVAILQGTTDLQVSTLDAQLLSAARPDAELSLIEGMNHVLKLASGDLAQQLPAYTDPLLPVVPALLDLLAVFAQP